MRLAVLSISRHVPGQRMVVSCPRATDEFGVWLQSFPNVELHVDPALRGLGYDVKPRLLLHMVERYGAVLWLDTDVLVTRDFRPLFEGADDSTLVVSEEVHLGQQQGSDYRTRAWGLEPGRPLPRTANTGVLRVTPAHVDLLRRWQELLVSREYRQAQTMQPHDRPLYLLTDMEPFTALLGARDFATIPVVFLREGRAIAQCYGPAGLTPADRLRSLVRGMPTFVHALGWVKPWEKSSAKRVGAAGTGYLAPVRRYVDLLHLELSPYTALANTYRDDLNGGTGWLAIETTMGRSLSALFRGNPPLQELPLSVVDLARQRLKALLRKGRIPLYWPSEPGS